jgi:23S rRNA pseudouridine2605 synthase
MPRKPSKRRPPKPRSAFQRPGKFASGLPPRRRPPAVAAFEVSSARGESRGDRLQKVLAAAGVGSRRECEQIILEGRVEVDGEVVSGLGACVDRQRHEIRVDGEPLSRPKLVYYAIHKPTGVVTTARDPAGRPRVIDLLPPGAGRVFTVGRLDLASEGLILATNDGELANQLTHPRHGVHKTYEVQVAGHPEPEVLAQLKKGVHLAEGYAHAVHVRLKSHKKRSSILEMVLDEGRNREVRRLFARVGHKVQRLTRIAVGPIRLGDLPRGAVRKLSPEEVRKLKAAAASPASMSPHRPATRGRGPRAGAKFRRRPDRNGGPGRPGVRPGAHPAAGQGRESRRIIGGEPTQAAAPTGQKPRKRRPRPPRRRPGSRDE